MAEELIRAACEAANCKYPDMEAMANFKREVTPSVVIGLIDGLRHAKGMAAINDARANGAAETIQHLRDDIAELRAQLPSQWGEAVAEVVWSPSGTRHGAFKALDGSSLETGTKLYTHPADKVAERNAELVELLRGARAGLDNVGLQDSYIDYDAVSAISTRIDAKLASL